MVVEATTNSAPNQEATHKAQPNSLHDIDTKPTTLSDHGSTSDIEEKPPQDGADLRAVDSNAAIKYPPMRKVAVIMAALYMSFFLVALVNIPPSILAMPFTDANGNLGSNHHSYRNTAHHRRVPLLGRCGLVW